MYAKILKETASQQTLLVVDEDSEDRDSLGENLSRYFKKIAYSSNSKEALALCRKEKFDLLLIDIDIPTMDSLRFINDVRKIDGFQTIAVYSFRNDDSRLLMELLCSGVSGFIKKPIEFDNVYKILSKVCTQLHDKQMLINYVDELEKLHKYGSSIQSSPSYPIKETVKSEINSASLLLVEDNAFEFFPAPSETDHMQEIDNSMYKDYFNYLDFDDREELRDLLNDIDTEVINAFSNSGGNALYVSKLGSSLMRYGNVLIHYQFFSDMGTAILEFGRMINDECEMLATQANDFQLLISGFCSVLQTFMAEVWEKNSDNPKFFNDSIVSDAGTIMGMITPLQNADSDDDLVFF